MENSPQLQMLFCHAGSMRPAGGSKQTFALLPELRPTRIIPFMPQYILYEHIGIGSVGSHLVSCLMFRQFMVSLDYAVLNSKTSKRCNKETI